MRQVVCPEWFSSDVFYLTYEAGVSDAKIYTKYMGKTDRLYVCKDGVNRCVHLAIDSKAERMRSVWNRRIC